MNESVKVKPIDATNFVKVEMTISFGKLHMLQFALEARDTPVARDLWRMLETAIEKAGI